MNAKSFILRKVVAIAICLAVTTMFWGCDNPVNNPDDPNYPENIFYYFECKSGKVEFTVTYNDSYKPDDERVLIFDDYGAKYRIERREEDQSGIKFEQIYIVDEKAKKSYTLFPESKKYDEFPPSGLKQDCFYYDYNGTKWWEYPNANNNFKKLSNRTIAGKECAVCSFDMGGYTYEYAGWKRVIFYQISYEKGGSPTDEYVITLKAKRFSEDIPANSFELPGGYTKW